VTWLGAVVRAARLETRYGWISVEVIQRRCRVSREMAETILELLQGPS